MNIVDQLKKDLDDKEKIETEANADNFPEGQLTDEDKARLAQMEAEQKTETVIVEEGEDGAPVEQPIGEYVKSLDKQVTSVETIDDAKVALKTLNKGDIKKSMEQSRAETRARALQAFKDMAIIKSGDEEITDEDCIKYNDAAIHALMEHFKLDRLTSDAISKPLHRMSISEIAAILPDEFIKMYVRTEDIVANNSVAKNRLLAVIEYLTVVGPEMDYLNEFIDNENKKAMAIQRIASAGVKLSDAIKDEKTMSEIIAKTTEICPIDDSFWARYIKLPNRVHNVFAQRSVLQTMYRDAYLEIAEDEEFKDCPQAMQVIQDEIAETEARIKVYDSICDLTLMRELYVTLANRYMTHGKLTQKYLIKEGVSAVDRARRCKQDLPFPGYDQGLGNKPEALFKRYMQVYPLMIANYNKVLLVAMKKEMEAGNGDTKTDVSPIAIEGYPETVVANVFSLVLVILMGRIIKNLTLGEPDKYSAITLDSYFQLFCRLGSDIYCMTDVWNLISPLVQFLLDNVKFDGKW